MHEPLDARRRYDEHHPSALPQARTPLGRRAVLGTTGALGAGSVAGRSSRLPAQEMCASQLYLR
ncbi:hypothetical protein, partial [Streptomyces sp. SID1143]|uniref:hypothetical protein n=1 Tax=Streptomyces sp. SID1143 TaxID=3425889 RepID=UPI00405670B6